jgi:hypothetical protein
MYSQVSNKTCPYARSPPNCPHSEMTAKGAPMGSNLLVRTDRSPLVDARREDYFLQADLPVLILETEPGLIFNPRREWDP